MHIQNLHTKMSDLGDILGGSENLDYYVEQRQ